MLSPHLASLYGVIDRDALGSRPSGATWSGSRRTCVFPTDGGRDLKFEITNCDFKAGRDALLALRFHRTGGGRGCPASCVVPAPWRAHPRDAELAQRLDARIAKVVFVYFVYVCIIRPADGREELTHDADAAALGNGRRWHRIKRQGRGAGDRARGSPAYLRFRPRPARSGPGRRHPERSRLHPGTGLPASRGHPGHDNGSWQRRDHPPHHGGPIHSAGGGPAEPRGPTWSGCLKTNTLPHRKVGTHRRVAFRDLADYKRGWTRPGGRPWPNWRRRRRNSAWATERGRLHRPLRRLLRYPAPLRISRCTWP